MLLCNLLHSLPPAIHPLSRFALTSTFNSSPPSFLPSSTGQPERAAGGREHATWPFRVLSFLLMVPKSAGRFGSLKSHPESLWYGTVSNPQVQTWQDIAEACTTSCSSSPVGWLSIKAAAGGIFATLRKKEKEGERERGSFPLPPPKTGRPPPSRRKQAETLSLSLSSGCRLVRSENGEECHYCCNHL